MLKELSKKNFSSAQTGWNEAIGEAESQISEALRRVRRLKSAIKTFEQLRDEDAPLVLIESDASSETGSVH